MTRKKKYKIALGIIIGIVLIIFLAGLVISNIISNKVVELLAKQKIENVHVSIERTKFSLFDRSLVFRDVFIGPTDDAMAKLKTGQLNKNSLHTVSASRIKLKGIDLTALLASKEIRINRLIIDNPLYQNYINNEIVKSVEKKKLVELDSIHIDKINGFRLDLISFNNLKVQVINVKNNNITFQNTPLSFEVTGMKLDQMADNYFKISPLEETFKMTRIHVEFPNMKYSFSVDAITYHYGDDHLQVSNLKYKPMVNKLTLANSYIYNNDIFDLTIKDLKIYNLDMEKVVEKKEYFMDSIEIDQLSVEIYKDKRKPFDLTKRPQLPHQLLKQMKTPLRIQKVSIHDSEMIYEEKLEHKDVLMKASMKDLKINMYNVTSIKKFRDIPLKIDLNTKFMGKANLNVDMLLPLADGQDTFFFSGYLGPSEMSYYDSAIIPALGLKILKGRIESLSFSASADNYTSKGKMKMLYSDLNAIVFKQKNTETNKFLSWSVNNLLYKSNPGKNGELREATMNFDRVIYKGYGNFLWKTIQSGIVNSIAPFGMTSEKEAAKKKRKAKREERRRKRNN